MQYLQDNDSFYPFFSTSGITPAYQSSPELMNLPDNNGATANDAKWAHLIYPYVKSIGVYVCPNTSDARALGRNVSYGFNFHYLSYSRGTVSTGLYYVAKDSAIEFASEMIAIADSDGTGTGEYLKSTEGNDPNRKLNHGYSLDPPTLPANHLPSSGTALFSRISTRHMEGGNVAFADGHVKWMKREALMNDNTYWNGCKKPGANDCGNLPQ